jgi:hypothetical protein
VSLTAETRNEHLVVLVDEVKATVSGDERRDLLAVLDELHADALTNRGVGLLRLDAELLQDDALGVRATGEGLLPLRTEVRLVEVLVRPAVFAAKLEQLTTGSETTSLTVEVYAKGEGEGGAEVSGRRAIRETSAFGKKKNPSGRTRRISRDRRRTPTPAREHRGRRRRRRRHRARQTRMLSSRGVCGVARRRRRPPPDR